MEILPGLSVFAYGFGNPQHVQGITVPVNTNQHG